MESRKTLTNSLVVLGSAAVLAVYTAGFARTEPAAAGVAGARPSTTPVGLAGPPSPTLAPIVLTPTPTVSPTATAEASANRTQRTSVPNRRPSSSGQPAVPTAPLPAQAPQPATLLRDGAYVGTGSSRHGSIEATVIVRGGAIISAEISRCGTRYPCSKIAALPGQVVARQGPAVDVVSGATDSVTAYRGAVTAALTKAR